ncbi:unnamed protein product [Strongylus vulgaris]|uniref:Uncharacterized protein n=1 Tax=Strongylus vulgaris TaxID=40348 RepID=A0A3P7JUT2_STRVU|nr:unnamed protein product [Strongylus vulgaris]
MPLVYLAATDGSLELQLASILRQIKCVYQISLIWIKSDF